MARLGDTPTSRPPTQKIKSEIKAVGVQRKSKKSVSKQLLSFITTLLLSPQKPLYEANIGCYEEKSSLRSFAIDFYSESCNKDQK